MTMLLHVFKLRFDDIALLTEHKLLPRSQHFWASITSDLFSYNTCDSNFDNFGVFRCGKAGTER